MNIIELAKEAGFGNSFAEVYEKRLERFAALVRAEALAEPDIEEMTLTQIASRHEPVKQEPVNQKAVGCYYGAADHIGHVVRIDVEIPIGTLLYAAPVSAKREWVDLTDDEVNEIVHEKVMDMRMTYKDLVRAVIAAFKEKNK